MADGKMTSTPCALRELTSRIRCEEFEGGILEVSIDGNRTQGGQVSLVTLQNGTVLVTCSMFVKRTADTWTLHTNHPIAITPQSAWRCGNDLILQERVEGSATLTYALRVSFEHMLKLVTTKK